MSRSANSAERIYTSVPETKRMRRRDGMDPDLSWYLECGDSALGKRGTLGGIVSVLEHGGHPDGNPSTDLYSDEQIGWARHVYGSVEKHRWLTAAWNALTPETQRILLAQYAPPPAEFRSDEGFGARDRFIEGKEGVAGEHNPTRTGVEALLGELACLALLLCEDPGKLLIACRDAEPTKTNKAGLVVVDRERQAQRAKVRAQALQVARAASERAHQEWAESKAGADPMRTRNQRVRILARKGA